MPPEGEDSMAWNRLKAMFVVTTDGADRQGYGQGQEQGQEQLQLQPREDPDQVLKELEKYQLPPEEKAELPPNTEGAALSGTIEFQALYDQAGIPNTDEVEALERFLCGLDSSLPDSSKLAAAKAFLGAIGKSPQDVITDAGRKITVVRAVTEAKRSDTSARVAERRAKIAELEQLIQQERTTMESLQKELESVMTQCAVEESRLQGARMFFGHVGEVNKS
jgi:hypothetical protein